MMNDQRGLLHSKHTAAGKAERLCLLESHFHCVGPALAALGSPRLKEEDLLDAYAVAWTAWRMARGKARYVPADPEVDSRALRMGIWY
jgi:predicted RNase H-like nuclease